MLPERKKTMTDETKTPDEQFIETMLDVMKQYNNAKEMEGKQENDSNA